MTIEEFLNSDVETPVAGSGAVFGLNMDGSVDQTDVGRMSEFNAHHGAYQGVDLRDPNLRGLAIGDEQAKTLGFKNRDEALGHVVKVVNYSTGLISPVQIVDKAPKSQQHVEMTPAAHAEVGSRGRDPLGIARYQSVEDFLGIPAGKPSVDIGTVTSGTGDVVGLPAQAVQQSQSNLPPEEQGLQNIIEKNLATGAAAGVYPKAQRTTLQDKIAQEPQLEPAPKGEDLTDRINKFLFTPEGAQVTRAAIQGAVKAIPSMALQAAEMGYEGLKFKVGDSKERAAIVAKLATQATMQGQQTAKDIQSPFGTPEYLRGAGQIAMMGAPGLELFRELRGVPKVEAPPVQPEAFVPKPTESLGPGTVAGDVSKALADRQFQMVPEPPPELAPVPPVEETAAMAAERAPGGYVSPETGFTIHPERGAAAQLPSETARIQQWLDEPADVPPEKVQTGEFQQEGYTALPTEQAGIGIKAAFSAKGATDVLYEKAFEALKAGKTTISGVKDPILARHKAAFDRGEIQSPEDLKIAEEGGAPILPADVGGSRQQPPPPPIQFGVEPPPIAGQRLVTGEPVGISEARTEAELGTGSVEPGAGAELGSGLDFGRDYINKGGDPRLPIRRALASGLVGKNEVGVVHAELERLRMERNKAAAHAADNPGDIAAQQAFDAADGTQRAWRKELQPVLTKASDALREAYSQSRVEHDPGSYAGLSDLIDEHFGGTVEPTPMQRTALRKIAGTVRESRTRVQQAGEHALTEARRGTKRRMTPEELHRDIQNLIAEEFKDCVV